MILYNNFPVSFVGTAISILVLDFIWIYYQKQSWRNQVFVIQRKKINIRIWSAVLAYIFMIFSVYFLSVSRVQSNNIFMDSIVYGFFVGIAMHGVFNTTNYAIFKYYQKKIVLKDTLWGIMMSIISTFIGAHILYW